LKEQSHPMKRAVPVLAVLCLAAPMAEAADARAAAAKQAAQRSGQAMIDGDFAALAGLTYPRIVTEMGGEQAMVSKLQADSQEMAKEGVKFLSVEARVALSVVEGDQTLFAVVPQTLTMQVPGGRLTQRGALLGISTDQGTTWTFIDVSRATRQQVLTVIPDLPEGVTWPPAEEPQFSPSS
jgi:hypothetical protein